MASAQRACVAPVRARNGHHRLGVDWDECGDGEIVPNTQYVWDVCTSKLRLGRFLSNCIFIDMKISVWCIAACSVSSNFRCDMKIVILITSLIQVDLTSWNKPQR